jgi:hypothetical protein
VAPLLIPTANIRMSHWAHLRRNILCAQCHGQVERIGLGTRAELPRMAGCLVCHAQTGAARGEARGSCNGCHLTDPGGQLRTRFATGRLKPPAWLHGAEHGPDWAARHKSVAGANSELCASCHGPSWCTDCHDGKLRPRAQHPGDWLSQHAESARQDSPRCSGCHQLQTFCADCHRRVGVARDSGSGGRLSGRRFHLPATQWTVAPRSAAHHSWEAQRNLDACVSCHSERDCATCHASRAGRGGQGVNPHPAAFASSCRGPYLRNPRPCLVCHRGNEPVLEPCR